MRHAGSVLKGLATLALWASLVDGAAVAKADAAPARTAWSSYLRSGPGDAYLVVDEVEHDTVVDLRGCQGRWCQIQDGRTLGYIDRDALTLPRLSAGPAPAPGSQTGPQSCLVAAQPGFKTPNATRFCQAGPANPSATR